MTLLVVLGALGAAALAFRHGQNAGGFIGGPISWPKLLWLAYALTTWFVVAFFFWRAPRMAPGLRRVFGLHLASFGGRAAVELYLIYGLVAWIPPYGIAHDVFHFALLTWARRGAGAVKTAVDRAASWFLVTVRIALVCEAVFAWLFHRAVDTRNGVYFASDDPLWELTNRLTLAVVLVAWPNLAYVMWTGRDALFPVQETAPPVGLAAGARHA